jgi:hypothetical protein
MFLPRVLDRWSWRHHGPSSSSGAVQASAAMMHCGLNWAYCAPLDLVPPVISRGAPRPTAWETSVSEGGKYGRGSGWSNFAYKMRLPRQVYRSFTCRKATTWYRWFYFPSEGRHAEDFLAQKIRRLQPGLNPRTWVPEANHGPLVCREPLDHQYGVTSQETWTLSSITVKTSNFLWVWRMLSA